MADLFQWWQQDLTILPDGDLLLASQVNKHGVFQPQYASAEGEQRVLRRLLTTPGQYIWHPEYGAGLPGYIGLAPQIGAINAIALAQMLLEDAVSQNPLPVVATNPIANGINMSVSYVDNNVGRQVTVGFNLNE